MVNGFRTFIGHFKVKGGENGRKEGGRFFRRDESSKAELRRVMKRINSLADKSQ